MSFNVEHQENYSIITSSVEKLNASNAPELKAAIVAINKNSINNIIIDLAETVYCDSSGLSALLTANRLCKDSNGLFVLCGLQSNVAKMISIAQLDRVLNIQDDLTKAVKEYL
jgi:anti-sigma B factor antagonist